jgi:hypothetical protein
MHGKISLEQLRLPTKFLPGPDILALKESFLVLRKSREVLSVPREGLKEPRETLLVPALAVKEPAPILKEPREGLKEPREGLREPNRMLFESKATPVIPRAGQFCALQTDAVRRPIQITPNKRSAVRGTAYTSPQLRKELNSFFPSNSQEIELLRSSDGTWAVDPELRFACTGLSKLDAYGVKRHEVSLHFYLTILARAQYSML